MTAEDERKLKQDLRNLLAALSIAQFGAPKDLNHVTNVYGSRKLDNLRVSEILSKVSQFSWTEYGSKCGSYTAYLRVVSSAQTR